MRHRQSINVKYFVTEILDQWVKSVRVYFGQIAVLRHLAGIEWLTSKVYIQQVYIDFFGDV